MRRRDGDEVVYDNKATSSVHKLTSSPNPSTALRVTSSDSREVKGEEAPRLILLFYAFE